MTLPLFKVVACSYEGSLFGWTGQENEGEDSIQLNLSFGFNCCQSKLRAVAISSSGKYLATGGDDERIRVFNIFENKSIGELATHTGAITCLKFFEDSHLFSGSEDHTICIWRVYDWNCLHILGGHKDTVTDLAVHPSGKLALSVSKDNTMKLWNLVHGRCGFTRRLKGHAEKVLWNHNSNNDDSAAEQYMLLYQSHIQVYLTATNECLLDLNYMSRINSAIFLPSTPLPTVTTSTTSTSITTHQDGNTSKNNKIVHANKSHNNEQDDSNNNNNSNDSNEFNIIILGDNKLLNIYNHEGSLLSSLNLSTIGGRPKDIQLFHFSPSNVSSQSSNKLNVSPIMEILQSVGTLASIITSTGDVIILSMEAVKQQTSVDDCIVVSTHVNIEPRLIAVAVTTHCDPSANMKKGKKRIKNTVDSVEHSESSVILSEHSKNSNETKDYDVTHVMKKKSKGNQSHIKADKNIQPVKITNNKKSHNKK